MKPTLFLAVETNAAAFIAPVLARWHGKGQPSNWRLVVGQHADNYFREFAPSVPRVLAADSSEGYVDARGKLYADDWQPQVHVISAAGHPLEFSAMQSTGGNPSGQFVDTWTNYRRRFEQDDRRFVADRVFAIDEYARDEMVEIGIPGDRVVIVGQPGWEAGVPLPAASAQQVLFLSAPVLDGYGRTLGYTEQECWAVVQQLWRMRPDLVADVRFAPHPAEAPPAAERLGRARLIRYRREVLAEVGTVLGMFSSPMVDAFLANRNVVSIQPGAAGPDQCPLSRHGLIDRVGTARELAAALETPRVSDRTRFAQRLRGSTDRLERAILELAE